MGAFTKATRKITAVATSAVMASSAVFGAGLSNYPDNFNNTGVNVVVGAAAQASDSTAANMIIDSLKTETMKYEVTYIKSTSGGGGDTIDAVRSNAELNFGEDLENVAESGGFDDSDTDVLEDKRFDNDISDEDYEQTLLLLNGKFNYALKDEVDGVEEITDGIFYESGEEFAEYTLDINGDIPLLKEEDYKDKLIGHELEIMGNEFVVADVRTDDSGDINKLVLTGGSQTYALSEGASISVPFGGRTYDIKVLNIDDDEVLLEVDGDAQSIDEYDSEDVSGLTIAITDLVSGSQHTKGNAVLVVGGSKLTLEEGRVKVNDEDFDDMYEDEYDINVMFQGEGLDKIIITYRVDDDVLLQEGDSLKDVLFDAFELVYEGTNDPDYSEVRLTADGDEITISGETDEGETLNRALLHSDSDTIWVRGDRDENRLHFKDSSVKIPSFVVNSSLEGTAFLVGNEDDAFLYEVTNVNDNNYETDFDELLRGDDLDDVKVVEWVDELGGAFEKDANGVDEMTVDYAVLGNAIPFENELYLELIADSEGANDKSSLNFVVDEGDVSYDDDGDEVNYVRIDITWDDEDEEFKIAEPMLRNDADRTTLSTIADGEVVWVNDGEEDNEEDSNDFKTFVNSYGVMVEYDSDDKEEVIIMTPDEQVRAEVSVVFGGGDRTEFMSESFMTMEEAEERADELKGESMYKNVEVNDMREGAVTFAISGPLLDSQVTGTSNMIVVGGPAVNRVAAQLLSLPYPSMGAVSGLSPGQGQIRMFESVNSVLVYGWSGADTSAAASRLSSGNLEGSQVNVG